MDYAVIKVDSINGYYLVYVQRNDSIFKIVSPKPTEEIKGCDRLKNGDRYPFFLHSSLSNWPAGLEGLSPKNNPLINCFSYDDSTSICVEEGMVRDLFYADNIRGKCFIGKR
jgi:hypothetical protein